MWPWRNATWKLTASPRMRKHQYVMRMTSPYLTTMMLCFAVVIAMAPWLHAGDRKSTRQNIEIGSYDAATAALAGRIPEAWKQQVNNTEPPSFLTWPMPGQPFVRGFGSDDGRHLAVDVAAPIGTPVQVLASGLVVYADEGVSGYGNIVIVLHGGGWVSLYAHLDRFNTKPGTWVRRGKIIALSGSTGISKGPHLHFAVFDNGKAIDPMPFIRGGPDLPQVASATSSP